MSEFFLRRLEAFGSLPETDRSLLLSLTSRSEVLPAGMDIIREDDNPSDVNLIASGFAFRYKLLSNGSRQIVGFLMPGDTCDLHVFILNAMDHGITTMTEAQVVKIPRRDILALLERPAISRAMLMVTLVSEATSRDWLTNVGARPAEQRLGHLLCEWYTRMKALDLAPRGVCAFPLTQAHMAEALGLSPVHVNRVLKGLREREMIVVSRKRLGIPDLKRLLAFSDYRPNYLHMQQGDGPP